jgi:DNA-binding transcriptional MerR regulator
MWRELALTMSQAASLTGVSERQIQHWMDRGYIRPSTPGTRKINGESLDMIALIRQARVAGIPLRRAVSAAREFLRQDMPEAFDGHSASSALGDLREHLGALQEVIGTVEHLLYDGHADGRVGTRALPGRDVRP